MKYEQITEIETQWKREYIIKKSMEGDFLTATSTTDEKELIELLRSFEKQPEMIEMWVTDYLTPEWQNKLKQSIRAKRKRFFNAQELHTRKKSIDLNYAVWERLSLFAKNESWTLSETIDYLIDSYHDQENSAISLAQQAPSAIAEIPLDPETVEKYSDLFVNNPVTFPQTSERKPITEENHAEPSISDPLINEIQGELAQLLLDIELSKQNE